MSFATAARHFASLLVFGFLGVSATLAQAQENQSYALVQPAQPSDTKDKIEVLEFFSYSCPHCAAIEPLVQAWGKQLPDNVVVHQVPVAFNASMTDLQKLFYTLDSLDRRDLHPEVFDTIHQKRQRIFDEKSIRKWAVEHDIDQEKFDSVFNSFGVRSKVARANELAKNYGINSTPTLAIGGKYLTSPAMAGGYQDAVDEAQRLLDTLQADQGAPQ